MLHSCAFISALIFVSGPVKAGTAGGVYDMSRLLNEPHPFAKSISDQKGQNRKWAVRPPSGVSSRRPQDMSGPSPRVLFAKKTNLGLSKKSESSAPSTVGNILREARIGMLVHDEGPFSRHKEEGYDTNFEFLFVSPDFFTAIWSPRPHAGGTINSSGNTSQAYLGATWGWEFWKNFYLNLSFGGALHTGEKETSDPDKKSLGCSTLFRESLDLGYRISGPHSVMFHFAHISNAKLCKNDEGRAVNEGLETLGIRYGYRF